METPKLNTADEWHAKFGSLISPSSFPKETAISVYQEIIDNAKAYYEVIGNYKLSETLF